MHIVVRIMSSHVRFVCKFLHLLRVKCGNDIIAGDDKSTFEFI